MNLVSEFDPPACDYPAADGHHQRLVEASQHGWLATSPLAYISNHGLAPDVS